MVTTEEKRIQFISLKVTNPQEINNLIDLIHDEYFEVDNIKYDREQGIVEIPYRRIFHDGPRRTVHNWLLYKVQEVDVIRAKMRILHIEEFEVNDPDQIGTYCFNDVDYDHNRSTLLLDSNTKLELRMKVSKLFIGSQDLEIRGKSRIGFLFLFFESTTGRVYD
ncbi:MAG: hypothetical protein A2169_14650 [Deltaproteobacteria bacterium RBG_13_47_9]|nr:MAG: hypothetical protein A2169_14650 [Deltaproteobacteria bacterium RBG_13_47_9]